MKSQALFYSPLAQVGLVVLAFATLYALYAGDRATRAVAAVHAVDWLLVGLLQPKHQHLVFPWGPFAADVAGLFFVAFVAVTSRRLQLAAMAAFLLLGVISYLNFLSPQHAWHRAFWSATYVWGFSALAALVAAAADDRRRVLRSDIVRLTPRERARRP